MELFSRRKTLREEARLGVMNAVKAYKTAVVNELHKPMRKNFPRRCTVLKGLNDLYQADLVEMIPYSRENKGHKYILTLINCFSKVAYAAPLQDKTGKTVTKAMEILFKQNKIEMKHLQTDEGKEYYNTTFANLMKLHNINHYSTKSDKKAAIIERFNRTLKAALYKWFSLQGTYAWLHVLPKVIRNYNNSFHRTIGMKPREVNKSNERTVLKRIKVNTLPAIDKKPPKVFYTGDKVRISKAKTVFTKGYIPNWSNEVFEVYRVQPTVPQTYILKDHNGEILQGSFYGHEMLKSSTGNVYLVEKVLKKKKDKVLVRWLGFDKSQDSWVSKKDLL